jgi:hypothetical protein
MLIGAVGLAGGLLGALDAPPMGQFYNQNIRGSGADGLFDRRTHRLPSY